MATGTVQVRCYKTMGVPNSIATCGDCLMQVTYFPLRAEREGFKSDLEAAEAWAANHECSTTKEVDSEGR